MDELAMIVVVLLLGFLARSLLVGRRCRCADAARTAPWRGDDVDAAVPVAPTLRGVAWSAPVMAAATVQSAPMAGATAQMAVAPSRITRVGY